VSSSRAEKPYLSLDTVLRYVPQMKALGVSEVARSPRGFLTAYKAVGGRLSRLSPDWRTKRDGLIARHMAQYRGNPTLRRRLALIAWAYDPDRRVR